MLAGEEAPCSFKQCQLQKLMSVLMTHLHHMTHMGPGEILT